MPASLKHCHLCSEMVGHNNMSRHLRRQHPKGSLSKSQVPLDYIRDATLCIMRWTDNLNIPSLLEYLGRYFPELPDASRLPIVVATFTAAQKAAATHMDATLDGADDRSRWARVSLARWAHGLSAIESGRQSQADYQGSIHRDSPVSSEDPIELYSPSTNFRVQKRPSDNSESSFCSEQVRVGMEEVIRLQADEQPIEQPLLLREPTNVTITEDNCIESSANRDSSASTSDAGCCLLHRSSIHK